MLFQWAYEERDNSNIEQNYDPTLRTIVLSLDVRALYPSINCQTARNMVFKMTLESEVDFDNIQYLEIGKILRVLCKDDELRNHKLISVLPARIQDLVGERKSTVTTSYLDSDYKDWKWVTRQESRQPSSRQKRVMMALLLASMTEWCMFDDTNWTPAG